jgi:signal transduction histidine kinase
MLSVAVLAVSGLTWLALQRVDDRLQELHRQSLTRVARAIDLSKRSSDLATSAPYLLTERSNFLIQLEGTKLISVLERVREDWPAANASEDNSSGQSVAAITQRIESSIRDLVAVSQSLEGLKADLRRKVAALSTLREISTRKIQTADASDAMRLVWWTLKSMTSDALNAAYANNLIGVGEEQRHFQNQRNAVNPYILTKDQDTFFVELDKIVSGPEGIFELRRSELALQLQASTALYRIRRDANHINEEASAYAARAETVLTRERSASSTMIRVTRISVAAISLASLTLALFAAVYVSRYVASNVARVSDAMVRLANGDRSSTLPRRMGGDDEIGDLFRSYRFFRANALRLDRTNRLLDQRNALFETVFAHISDGIAITDEAGLISTKNPAFDKILRIEHGKRLLEPFVDWLKHGRFSGAVVRASLNIQYSGFVELSSEDGQVLELRFSPLPNEGQVWLISDVTERRKLSQRVEQIDRIETLGKVAGDTAHDFANILSTIRTHVHLLNQKAPPNLGPNLSAIENAVEFGTSLTDRLLAFSKKQRLAPEIIDINPLVAGLVELAEIGLKDGVKLEVSYEKEALHVLVDPGQLESALFNLILNANNAIESQGTIRVALTNNTNGDAQIIVADDGCGMSSEVRKRAIEPFFTTRAKEGGTGLGLSIVYGFIKQSGGNLEIESEAGQFTSIRITLPLALPQQADKNTLYCGRALLVDDNHKDLANAIQAFTTFGFESIGCSSAIEALQILQNQSFDIIVSDLDLGSQKDGADLLMQVGIDYPMLKRVLISGRSIGDYPTVDGAWFFSKPVDMKKLADAVLSL